MRGGKTAVGARLVARAAGEAVKARVHAERLVPSSRAQRKLLEFRRHLDQLPAHRREHPAEQFETFLLPGPGDSALVGGDERTVKVHVHVNHPRGTQRGRQVRALGDIEINDMHAQTRDRDERLTAAPAVPDVGEGGSVVVAVVAGAGNQELFLLQLGCHAIVDGGQVDER